MMSRLNYNDPGYVSRLKKRRQKRKKNNIVILMVFLNVIVVLALLLVLGKFIMADKPVSNYEVTELEQQSELEHQTEVSEEPEIEEKAEEKKEEKSEKENIKEDKKEDVKEDKKEPKQKVSANYSSHYCYEADKQERYENYHSNNPSRSVDEVVWQVNANLDKPFYGFDVPVADIRDPLVIVNKYYKVSKAQEPVLTTVEGYLMTPETAEAYKRMKSDAAQNGLSIQAASTYRSVSYQEGLYNSYLNRDPQSVVDTYSARPGYSEHHTGMAIDFIGSFGSLNDFANTKEYPWVRDNCHKYGFIIRYTAANQWITGYKDEPWHLRYVGVSVATDMKNKGVSSFEEYKVKYIDHRP